MFYKWKGSEECKSQFNMCEICKKQPFTPYMVKSEVWVKEHKFLCLNCLQEKIGRKISIDDFSSCCFTNLIKLGFMLAEKKDIDLTDF